MVGHTTVVGRGAGEMRGDHSARTPSNDSRCEVGLARWLMVAEADAGRRVRLRRRSSPVPVRRPDVRAPRRGRWRCRRLHHRHGPVEPAGATAPPSARRVLRCGAGAPATCLATPMTRRGESRCLAEDLLAVGGDRADSSDGWCHGSSVGPEGLIDHPFRRDRSPVFPVKHRSGNQFARNLGVSFPACRDSAFLSVAGLASCSQSGVRAGSHRGCGRTPPNLFVMTRRRRSVGST